MKLTPDRLRELLAYDRTTGVFRWREDRRQMKAGDVAGSIASCGYRYIKIDGRSYRANRLAVLYVTGQWPVGTVDHRDLDKTNDRYGNLRVGSMSQNKANIAVRADNQLGVKGVHRIGNRYRSQIQCDGQKRHLGTFASASEAHAAYVAAAEKHFGEFARAA
jgi:hypothetical protein